MCDAIFHVRFSKMSETESQMEETGVESEQTIECRACLQILNKDCVLYNIFEGWTPPWDGMENSIAEDLAKIANVQISESDRHSKIICETCCQLLLRACNFTAIVKRNDEILRQRYEEDKTQLNLSDDRVWPKPIQVDKSIVKFMYEDVDTKKETVSDDEEYPSANGSYDPSQDDLPNLDIIKVEPEEIIQQQPSQLHIAVNDHELNKPVNKEKTKDSAKISDDELILRRKRKNAERVRAYRARKRALKYEQFLLNESLNSKKSNLTNGNSDSGEIANDDERRRVSSRVRFERYRYKIRHSIIKKFERASDDTQIPGPSYGGPELTIKESGKDQRITIHNSQIPRRSANRKIPKVVYFF
ncbi:uncharacterized protein LOC123663114 isoform X2 [Melitaea cinxia]|uniref:uncharacterized protein LOC123663114 isoform X2 n=1 Tax=Melitaea cinxia TaxID=113334 RepID=UPI001E272189|nr:uncharacterized protein LOC123663114 isoform X2 [Melitaea cinxia]